MKNLILFIGVVLLVVALRNFDWAGAMDDSRAPVMRGAALPFRAAMLYTKEPDRELFVPVKGVRLKQIANTWHAPRPGERLHQGQDIFAKLGTPVLSATEGYVVRIGENALGGNTVSVLGAGGRNYYYAHLDSYAENLAVGDHVTPETVLGRVGTTGNAAGTPPHLHFGVYTMEGAINPLPLLTERN